MRTRPWQPDSNEITEEFPKYGYRKVTRELHRKDIPVNHKKVHRIMREKGLLVTNTKQFVKTTDSNHPYPVYPNLTKDLQVTSLNQVWVADITYIRIAVGFVYLAVNLDLCSRKAIGYALSRTIDTSLSLSALRMAIQSRNPPARRVHIRSAVSSSASSCNYSPSQPGFRSASPKGTFCDNAFANLLQTFKTEVVSSLAYRTETFSYERPLNEQVYNQKACCKLHWITFRLLSTRQS